MKRTLFLMLMVAALFVALPSAVFADSTRTPPPGWSGSYSVVSPDEQYVLVMLMGAYKPPDKDVSPETDGANKLLLKYPASGLYRNGGSPRLLWAMQYIPWEQGITLSSDGHHMIVWGSWPQTPFYDAPALSFFNDGLLLRTYTVRSLVAYPTQLPHSTSHYQWLLEDSLHDMRGLLTVETQNHEKYVFGLSTGEVISRTIPTATVGDQANKPGRIPAAAMSTAIPKPEVEREVVPIPQQDYTMAMGFVFSAGSLAALFTGVSVVSGKARRKRKGAQPVVLYQSQHTAVALRIKSLARGRKVALRRLPTGLHSRRDTLQSRKRT